MIKIKIFNDHPKYKIRHAETIDFARHVLRSESSLSAEINIIFTTDKEMKELNLKFLHHKYTTDVISFPLSYDGKKTEGEVYINVDQARRQAKGFGVSINEENARLVIHGVLHLIGYDDKNKRGRECMTRKENLYLAKILSK